MILLARVIIAIEVPLGPLGELMYLTANVVEALHTLRVLQHLRILGFSIPSNVRSLNRGKSQTLDAENCSARRSHFRPFLVILGLR